MKNKGRITLCLLFSTLSALLLALCLILPDKANCGPYLDSAHGNTSYGVNRTSLSSFNYSKGNCVHCHEQHASIGGAEPAPTSGSPDEYELFRTLFGNQSGGLCFACHRSGSRQTAMPNQYNYSYIAGGDTNTCPTDIQAAFMFMTNNCGATQSNCSSDIGSAHCLEDIQDLLKSATGQGWGFSSTEAENNPCSGCHNPHRAQRDYSGQAFQWGTGKSALSRPSQHSKDNNAWQLWGDESGISCGTAGDEDCERMSELASFGGATYHSPFRYGATTGSPSYEPDGSTTTNGSNIVNTVTFCLDCHKDSVDSTYRGSLNAINWGVSDGARYADVHGLNDSTDNLCNYGNKREPYSQGGANEDTNYVLSCLECHEPHGAPNGYLIRQEVNNRQVSVVTGRLRTDGMQLWNLCRACHQNFGGHTGGMGSNCQGCHYHGQKLNGMCTGAGRTF